MNKRILITIAAVLFGLLLLACAGFVVPFEIVGRLAFGWVFFLWRVLPDVTVEPGPWLTLLVCGALLTAGLHGFLRWLYREAQRSRHPQSNTVAIWPFRWTAALLTLVLLMFVAGIAMVGATHQLAWLATMDGPIVESSGRAVARRSQSRNNLKYIGLAVHNYHDQVGTLPPGVTINDRGELLHGWPARLLPYLDSTELYEQIDFDRPWHDPANAPVFRRSVPPLLLPLMKETHDANGYALSGYAANVHVMGGTGAHAFDEFPAGMSYTILAGEAAGNFQPWGSTSNCRDPLNGINRTPDGFGSNYDGAQFLFLDARVLFLSENIDSAVLEAISRGQEAPRAEFWD